jgi:transcription-repair coupling factor (superfamily II helicase)
VLLVTAQPENSKRLHEQLSSWCPPDDVYLFPETEILFRGAMASGDVSEPEKLRALSALAGTGSSKPSLVVAPAAALMQKLAPRGDYESAGLIVSTGMEIEPFELLRRWQEIGYELENTVEIPGTMSHRGGILDIYPPAGDFPARLEFFGNTIESIRFFDPDTQRSLNAVKSLAVGPAAVLPSASSGRESLLDYLPENGLLILDEPRTIDMILEDMDTRAAEMLAERQDEWEENTELPEPYFTPEELKIKTGSRRRLEMTSLGIIENDGRIELDFSSPPSYAGQIPALIEKIPELLKEQFRLVMVSHQADRLAELLESEDIIAAPLNDITEAPAPGSLSLVQGLLSSGWTMNGNVCLLTDTEIFGFTKQRRLNRRRPVQRHMLFAEINPGDYVVHVEHGIAKFVDVVKMRVNSGGGEKEYLVLEYSAGDKLYVPTDQIDRVSRYVGSAEHSPG